MSGADANDNAPRGSPIVLMFKRFAEDKVDKFSVTLCQDSGCLLMSGFTSWALSATLTHTSTASDGGSMGWETCN
eukprot:1816291-Rhodomonas_salina.2